MTDHELVDAIASFNSNMHFWATLYIALLSAYLVTAYKAGANLSKSQTMIINTGCIIFAGTQIVGVRASGMRSLEFAAELQAINPEREFALTPIVLWVVALIMLIGILACLKFTWDIRHPTHQRVD